MRLAPASIRPLTILAALAVTAAGCLADPADEDAALDRDDALSASCANLPAWTIDRSYHAGDLVQYGGKAYKCLQGHVALFVWTPDIVPALWQETAVCSSSSSSSSSSASSSGSGGTRAASVRSRTKRCSSGSASCAGSACSATIRRS